MPWRNWAVWPLGQVEAREEVGHSFDAAGPLALQLNVGVGEVQVRAGSGDRVEVRGTKHAWGANRAEAEARLREFRVDVRLAGAGTITVESDAPRAGEARSAMVDLVITLPRRADVLATVNVGSLRVEGLEGTFDLTSNVGEVAARDVALTGSSRLVSNVGEVTVRLPASASFELDARSSIGDVSCGFPLQGEYATSTLVGKRLSGRVGESPDVSLTLRVSTGDVRVERGK